MTTANLPEEQFEVRAGDDVNHVARKMSALAEEKQTRYVAEFNGSPLVAEPGMTATTVVQSWKAEMDRKAEEYRRSPEGQKAALVATVREASQKQKGRSLMERLDVLDFSNFQSLIDFMVALEECQGRETDAKKILDKFRENDFYPGAYVDDGRVKDAIAFVGLFSLTADLRFEIVPTA